MRTELISIDRLVPNKDNPRTIRDANFEKLVKSLKDFPEMLEARPIVVNEQMTILGGNYRYRAAKAAGLTEVWATITDFTPEQQREFIIKDNVSGGDWNWEMLVNEWDTTELADWGLDIPDWVGGGEGQDYSDKNKEIDIDELDTEMVIKLKYNEDEYNLVRGQLAKIAQTPEQAVWKLLGND